VDLELASTLGWLSGAGAETLLVTAVDRVATITGPDTALVRRVARSGLPLMAAGGIRSLADLEAVRDAGASGAVVGRSALEGSLDLAAALAWSAA
jgi:phosphoribosylformimino-5-aminoimidazole carboxamide ribotide isomerase